MARAAELGADQLTTYPLFTFPYTAVGEYLHLTGGAHARPARCVASSTGRSRTGAQGTASSASRVWGFKRGGAPRYSSVTRDGYIGIGPGLGLAPARRLQCSTPSTWTSWEQALDAGRSPIALRMPFEGEMGGWWWLYWRFYDTRIPMDALDEALGDDARRPAGGSPRWNAPGSRAARAALELTD